jgi:hypothetical protein
VIFFKKKIILNCVSVLSSNQLLSNTKKKVISLYLLRKYRNIWHSSGRPSLGSSDRKCTFHIRHSWLVYPCMSREMRWGHILIPGNKRHLDPGRTDIHLVRRQSSGILNVYENIAYFIFYKNNVFL